MARDISSAIREEGVSMFFGSDNEEENDHQTNNEKNKNGHQTNDENNGHQTNDENK